MTTISWERYVFRLMKQGEKESLISFYERLRNQTESCHFVDTESQIKDQIILKCVQDELRQKAFKKEMSLEQLLLTGETIEEAKVNCGNGGQAGSSNQEVQHERRRSCKRCGSKELNHSERSCPPFVKNILCGNCQRRGHFQNLCLLPKKVGSKRMRSIAEESDEMPLFKFQRTNSSLSHSKSQQVAFKPSSSLSKGLKVIQPKKDLKAVDTVKSPIKSQTEAIETKNENIETGKSPVAATSYPQNSEKQKIMNKTLDAEPLNIPTGVATNDQLKGTGNKIYKNTLAGFLYVARDPKITLNGGKQISSKKEEINSPQGPSRALILPLPDSKVQCQPIDISKANEKKDATGIRIFSIDSIITSPSGAIVGNQIKKMGSSIVDLTSPANIGIPNAVQEIKNQVITSKPSPPNNNEKAAHIPEKKDPQIKMIQQSYGCFIGMQPYTIKINTECPLNIISKSLLDKLLITRSEVLTQSALPVSVKHYKFCGNITTKVQIRNKTDYVNFYIQKSDKDFALISREMAVKYGLLHT